MSESARGFFAPEAKCPSTPGWKRRPTLDRYGRRRRWPRWIPRNRAGGFAAALHPAVEQGGELAAAFWLVRRRVADRRRGWVVAAARAAPLACHRPARMHHTRARAPVEIMTRITNIRPRRNKAGSCWPGAPGSQHSSGSPILTGTTLERCQR